MSQLSQARQELAIYTDNPIQLQTSIQANHLNFYATYDVVGYSQLRVFDVRVPLTRTDIRDNVVLMSNQLGATAASYHVFVFYYGTNNHKTFDYYYSPSQSYLVDMAYAPVAAGNHSILLIISSTRVPMLTCQRLDIVAYSMATHGNMSANDDEQELVLQCPNWYDYHTMLFNAPFYNLAEVSEQGIRYFHADYYVANESEDYNPVNLQVDLNFINPSTS